MIISALSALIQRSRKRLASLEEVQRPDPWSFATHTEAGQKTQICGGAFWEETTPWKK